MPGKRKTEAIEDLYKKIRKIQRKLDIMRAVPESSSTEEEEEDQEMDDERESEQSDVIEIGKNLRVIKISCSKVP